MSEPLVSGGGTVAATRRCLHLRTKMDYVTHDEERPSGRPEADDLDRTCGGTAHKHYCLHTMTVIGPDDDIVGPRICAPDRTCYESSGF